MKTSIWLVCFFVITHLASGVAIAQVPSTISYQGILTDSEGQPVEDGSYDMHFRLYSASGTQTAIWQESRNVSVQNGLFSVLLGTINPLDLPFDQQYYLGMAIGEALELSPRMALTSSAYSLRARTVDQGQVVMSLNGLRDNIALMAGDNIALSLNDTTIVISALIDTDTGTITGVTAGQGLTGGGTAGEVSLSVASGGITAEMLADSAVTADKLAAHAVGSTALQLPLEIKGSGTAQRGVVHIENDDRQTNSIALSAFTSSSTRAILGVSTSGVGITGVSQVGIGVRGETGGSSTAAAVEGRNTSQNGRAIYGHATSTTGPAFGIYGQVNSPDGYAGYFQGRVRSTGEIHSEAGGFRFPDGTVQESAAGILSFPLTRTESVESGPVLEIINSATSQLAYAVQGVTHGSRGHGVTGRALSSNGESRGVAGFSSSSSGTGVWGQATSWSGETRGVGGLVWSSEGTGVWGRHNSTSGGGRGIHGDTQSSDGFAGYFTGAAGSKNYFQRNVGIGTEEPSELLHVFGGLGTSTMVERSGGAAVRTTAALNEGSIGTSNNTAFRILTNNTVRMHIPSTGGVGIGTTNPGSFLLAVNGDAAKPGGGSWSVFSDERLKRDIRQLEPGSLDRLLSIHGYTFEYYDEAIENRLALPGRQTGLIAQEVLEVFPDWVGTDDEGYLYVTERGLTAQLIEALRELKNEKDKEINTLHQRIQQLEMQLLRITSAE
jgi:hypothetical protein